MCKILWKIVFKLENIEKGKLLHISFEYNDYYKSKETIFSKGLWYLTLKCYFKDKITNPVY